MGDGRGGVTDKAAWRRALLDARRSVPDDARRADAAALAAGLAGVVDGVDDPICLYVPVGSEPGLAPDGARPVLDAAVALGRRVLLPVVVGAGPHGERPLDWAHYDGPDGLARASYGLLEPAGPRLGSSAVASAGLVVVPALAVDRRGVRLGRGAGHYDRTLPLVGPATRLVALVGDDELVDELPAEGHDVRMHAAWRPNHGVTGLPG